jgi:uncharacterized protein (TIGR00661 family)
MNILYGIQATGNGHISRSREVVRALRRAGHDVRVLLSGRAPDKLWEVEDLRPYQARPGLTFAVSRGRIRPLRTVRSLNVAAFYRDIRNFDARGVDLVVSDFEPLSVRIAQRRGLVSIGLGHQYAFRYPVPKPRGRWINRLVLARYAPVSIPLGLHWHHFNAPILPPIIPELPAGQPIPRKALVYLPFEDPDRVLATLGPLADWEFYVYQDVSAPRDHGHRKVRPFSRSGFQRDLVTAEAVVANAGFELASEALHLGRKLVVCPLRGQMEQEANALACEQLGLAAVIRRLESETVRRGLERPPGAPRPVPNWLGALTAWINRGTWSDVGPLVEAAWRQPPRTERTALAL